MGPLVYSEDQGEVFLGHSVTQHKLLSDETAHVIDEEIRKIIDRNYERSERILNDGSNTLHLMADALIKYETIDASQIDDIMARQRHRVRRRTGLIRTPIRRRTVKARSSRTDKDEKSPSSKIGGPASSH